MEQSAILFSGYCRCLTIAIGKLHKVTVRAFLIFVCVLEIFKIGVRRVEIETEYSTQPKFVAVFEHSDCIADAWIVDAADLLNDFLSPTVKMGSR